MIQRTLNQNHVGYKVQSFSRVYQQENLELDDTKYYEPELSYDYLSQDYGIVNSLTEKGEL